MLFSIEIVPSAMRELKAIDVFHRRRIVEAIDTQLQQQPTAVTRHRKILQSASASFVFEPPLWELRIGDFRVFYDVDEERRKVFVRAVREKPPHATSEQVL